MTACETIKQYLLKYLREDAEHAEQGRSELIGRASPTIPDINACFAENAEQPDCLGVLITFWDFWQDSRNHGWGYYPGIEEQDWPAIARRLCDALEAGSDADELSRLARVFDLPETPPFWTRLWRKLIRRA